MNLQSGAGIVATELKQHAIDSSPLDMIQSGSAAIRPQAFQCTICSMYTIYVYIYEDGHHLILLNLHSRVRQGMGTDSELGWMKRLIGTTLWAPTLTCCYDTVS